MYLGLEYRSSLAFSLELDHRLSKALDLVAFDSALLKEQAQKTCYHQHIVYEAVWEMAQRHRRAEAQAWEDVVLVVAHGELNQCCA